MSQLVWQNPLAMKPLHNGQMSKRKDGPGNGSRNQGEYQDIQTPGLSRIHRDTVHALALYTFLLGLNLDAVSQKLS